MPRRKGKKQQIVHEHQVEEIESIVADQSSYTYWQLAEHIRFACLFYLGKIERDSVNSTNNGKMGWKPHANRLLLELFRIEISMRQDGAEERKVFIARKKQALMNAVTHLLQEIEHGHNHFYHDYTKNSRFVGELKIISAYATHDPNTVNVQVGENNTQISAEEDQEDITVHVNARLLPNKVFASDKQEVHNSKRNFIQTFVTHIKEIFVAYEVNNEGHARDINSQILKGLQDLINNLIGVDANSSNLTLLRMEEDHKSHDKKGKEESEKKYGSSNTFFQKEVYNPSKLISDIRSIVHNAESQYLIEYNPRKDPSYKDTSNSKLSSGTYPTYQAKTKKQKPKFSGIMDQYYQFLNQVKSDETIIPKIESKSSRFSLIGGHQ